MFMNEPPALNKLLSIPTRTIFVDLSPLHYGGIRYGTVRIIPEGVFSPEEIEELRQVHEERWKNGHGAVIANFLPDKVRPKDVPQM